MAVAFRVFLTLRVHRTLSLQREERPLFSCHIGKTRPAVLGKGKLNVHMQQAIQLRQAQPTVLQQLETLAKSMRRKFDRKVANSELCQVLGITPMHFSLQGLAISAALFLTILLVCGVAEWLEGGAA